MINLLTRIHSFFAPAPRLTYALNQIDVRPVNGAKLPKNGDIVHLIDEQYAIDIECIYQDGELLPKGCE